MYLKPEKNGRCLLCRKKTFVLDNDFHRDAPSQDALEENHFGNAIAAISTSAAITSNADSSACCRTFDALIADQTPWKKSARRKAQAMVNPGWEFAGAVLAALIGLAATVWVYRAEQLNNRKWNQIQFLLKLHEEFFQRPEIRDCIHRLDNQHEYPTLERLFTQDRSTLTTEDLAILEEFRSLFQLFDNLSLSYRMGTLTLEQIDLFGWYLHKINSAPAIRAYCQEQGFQEVIKLAQKLEHYAFARA